MLVTTKATYIVFSTVVHYALSHSMLQNTVRILHYMTKLQLPLPVIQYYDVFEFPVQQY